MNTQELELESESHVQQPQPSPVFFFEIMHAYQRTAALKAAVELDLFSAIGETTGTLAELMDRLGAPERGVRALCDFLVIMGLVTKDLSVAQARYGLTPNAAAFLDKRSPMYLGSATTFMGSPYWTTTFNDLAAVVRAGGPIQLEKRIDQATPLWVDFARGMGPILFPVAEGVAQLLKLRPGGKVLDVASSHGMFGIAVARRNPEIKVVALDFPEVLAVTSENVGRFGLLERYTMLAGDALEVPLGDGFDAVLVPNLLHHWGRTTIMKFVRKVYAALAPGGRIVVVEFAPNDDRVTPPVTASFVINMLASTPAGDAYTLSEHLEMLREAGFVECETHPLSPTPETAILGAKR